MRFQPSNHLIERRSLRFLYFGIFVFTSDSKPCNEVSRCISISGIASVLIAPNLHGFPTGVKRLTMGYAWVDLDLVFHFILLKKILSCNANFVGKKLIIFYHSGKFSASVLWTWNRRHLPFKKSREMNKFRRTYAGHRRRRFETFEVLFRYQCT